MELAELFLNGADAIEYQGEFIKVPQTHFIVRPLQERIDTYIAGQVFDRELQKRMALKGYIPFVTTGWSSVADIATNRAKIVEAYEEVGLSTAHIPFAMQAYVHVCGSEAEALEAADNARYVRRIAMSMREEYAELDGAYLIEAPARGEPPLADIVANTMIGSPEKIAAQLIERVSTLKPTHMNTFHASGSLPHSRVMSSIERFMTEVVPMVERELGPLRDLGAVPRGESRTAV